MTNDNLPVTGSLKGWTWGSAQLDESLGVFDFEGKSILSIHPSDVAQATIQGRSDLALELLPEAAEKEDECLAEIRFFVPNDDLLNTLKEEISKKGSSAVGGEKVVSLLDIPLVLPRGHFDLDFYTTSIKLRGKSFDYAIKYSNINRAFVLMKPDGVHVAFVIGLDKPVRQGNTAYTFLCAQFDMNRTEDTLEVRLPEETMYAESGLEKSEAGKPLADVLQRLLKYFAKIKVQFASLDFNATNGKNCVRCSHRATEGHLYCLKKAFLFITKPVVYIKYDEVVAVEFSRAESWMTQTRFFDLKVYKKGENQPYDFQQIDRNEYNPLIEFLQSSNIKIRNLEKKSESDKKENAGLLEEEFDDEDDEEDSDFGSVGESSEEADDSEEEDGSDEEAAGSDDGAESTGSADQKQKKKKHKRSTDDQEDKKREKKEKKSKKDKKDKKSKKDKKDKKKKHKE